MTNWKKADKSDIVCYCKKTRLKTIKKAIKKGANSLKKVKKETKAGTGSKCKKVHPDKRSCCKDIKTLIKLYS